MPLFGPPLSRAPVLAPRVLRIKIAISISQSPLEVVVDVAGRLYDRSETIGYMRKVRLSMRVLDPKQTAGAGNRCESRTTAAQKAINPLITHSGRSRSNSSQNM
jgi:hypothetical protein